LQQERPNHVAEGRQQEPEPQQSQQQVQQFQQQIRSKLYGSHLEQLSSFNQLSTWQGQGSDSSGVRKTFAPEATFSNAAATSSRPRLLSGTPPPSQQARLTASRPSFPSPTPTKSVSSSPLVVLSARSPLPSNVPGSASQLQATPRAIFLQPASKITPVSSPAGQQQQQLLVSPGVAAPSPSQALSQSPAAVKQGENHACSGPTVPAAPPTAAQVAATMMQRSASVGTRGPSELIRLRQRQLQEQLQRQHRPQHQQQPLPRTQPRPLQMQQQQQQQQQQQSSAAQMQSNAKLPTGVGSEAARGAILATQARLTASGSQWGIFTASSASCTTQDARDSLRSLQPVRYAGGGA